MTIRGRAEEKTMLYRTFGSTNRKVAIIGQGTWYIEQADSRQRSALCAAASTSA